LGAINGEIAVAAAAVVEAATSAAGPTA